MSWLIIEQHEKDFRTSLPTLDRHDKAKGSSHAIVSLKVNKMKTKTLRIVFFRKGLSLIVCHSIIDYFLRSLITKFLGSLTPAEKMCVHTPSIMSLFPYIYRSEEYTRMLLVSTNIQHNPGNNQIAAQTPDVSSLCEQEYAAAELASPHPLLANLGKTPSCTQNEERFREKVLSLSGDYSFPSDLQEILTVLK